MRRLVVVLAAAIVGLAAVEAGLRLYDWSRGASSRAATSWSWDFTQDRFLGFRARPRVDITYAGGATHATTNADGFRNAELTEASLQGKRLIVCIGESSTWGTGSTSAETTWPQQLGLLLGQQDPRFVVLNAGIPGYTTIENVQLLNLRLLKYAPEAVVYMGFRNDVAFYATSLSREVDLNFYPRPLASIPATLINELWMRSALLGRLVNRFGQLAPLDDQGVKIPAAGAHLTPRGIETMNDQIALMKALTDRHGAKLFWVDQPIDYARVPDKTPYEEARSLVAVALDAHQIPLLTAHRKYDYATYPLLDDVHFSDAGNRHLAEILSPQVTQRLSGAGRAP